MSIYLLLFNIINLFLGWQLESINPMHNPPVNQRISKHLKKLFFFQIEIEINIIIHEYPMQDKANSELTIINILFIIINNIYNISIKITTQLSFIYSNKHFLPINLFVINNKSKLAINNMS